MIKVVMTCTECGWSATGDSSEATFGALFSSADAHVEETRHLINVLGSVSQRIPEFPLTLKLHKVGDHNASYRLDGKLPEVVISRSLFGDLDAPQVLTLDVKEK